MKNKKSSSKPSSAKPSKKKVLGFISILAVIVVAVVVLIKFVFPDAKLIRGYELAYSVSTNEDLDYLQDNIPTIVTKIRNVDATNQTATKLEKDYALLSSYTSLNQLMQSSLLFNQKGNDYNKLARELEKKSEKTLESLNNCASYLKDTFMVYIDSNPTYTLTDIEKYVNTFNGYLTTAVSHQDEFYDCLVEVYNETFSKSLKNNCAIKINVNLCDYMLDSVYENFESATIDAFIKLKAQTLFDCSTFVTYLQSEKLNTAYNKIDAKTLCEKYLEGTHQEFIDSKDNKDDYQQIADYFFN